MGNDAPLAVLSEQPILLYNYFKQIFAQVSNPAIDSIREELVMSLTSHLGKERNLLKQSPEHAHLLKVEHPVLTNIQLEQIKELHRDDFKTITLSILFEAKQGPQGMKTALDSLCQQAVEAVQTGHVLLILSDRGVNEKLAPIPALLGSRCYASSFDPQTIAYFSRDCHRNGRGTGSRALLSIDRLWRGRYQSLPGI